jgi:PAS domain S-box-containing protein
VHSISGDHPAAEDLETISHLVAEAGGPISWPPVQEGAHPALKAFAARQGSSVMVHPLCAEDQGEAGAIVVLDAPSRTWSTEDFDSISNVADLVCTALNARRMESELSWLTTVASAGRSEFDARFQQNLEFLSLLVDTLPTPIFYKDAEGIYRIANRPYCASLGREQNEVVGARAKDVFPPHVARRLQKEDEELMRLGGSATEEIELPGEDGVRVMLLTRDALQDADGRPFGLMGVLSDVTPLRRAQEAAREKAERLLDALRIARAGAWEWEARTGEVRWSDENFLLLGYRPGEVEPSYENWVRRLHPEDREEAARIATEAFETGCDLDFEVRVVWPDGSVHWLHDMGKMERDASGAPIRLIGFQIDITERKQAWFHVQEQEARYRLAAQATNDVIWDLDLETNRIWWSNALERIFGFEQEAGQTTDLSWWTQLVHPDDVDAAIASLQKAADRPTETHWTATYRFLRADGHYAHVLDRGFFVRSESGKARRLVGAMMDISERIHSEEALRASEARWRGLIERQPEAALITANGRFLYMNPAAVALAGASRMEDLLGRDLLEIIHPESRDLVLSRRKLLEENISLPLQEVRIRSLRGEERYVELVSVPIEYEGRPAVQSVLRDVTARQAYEAGLIEARQSAEDLARLKSAVLTNMSHEIRTPLTSIIGFSDLLADLAPDELQEMVDAIQKGGARLLSTLNSVLDLAQLEGRAVDLNPEPIDLREEVREAVGLLHPRAFEAGLDLEVDLPDRPFVGELDRRALHRVLDNLIGNAIKFTEAGSVTVRLSREGDKAVIGVTDTGIGIEPSFMPYLFAEFKQESAGLARSFEGAGIGLTIVGRLLELMGGTIRAESVKGRGSTFTIRLPLRPKGRAGKPASTRSTKRLRVLVADSSEEDLRLLTHILGASFEVEAAGTAAEAISRVSKMPFDLVMLDIHLEAGPENVSVLSHLRSTPAFAGTPVVGIIPRGGGLESTHYARQDFSAHLSKPYSRGELFSLIEDLFRHA